MKEVLLSMSAVSLVLLLIIISARFVTYLAEAAAGELDAGVLLTLMAFRLPAYLELILPLGLFIGILMAYGRLYIDSEMAVLSACGVSEIRLLMYTVITSSIVATFVALFSTFLGPQGVKASESLLAQQRSRTDFETLKPARFHGLNTGRGISYAESVSDDKQQLRNVFMAEIAGQDDAPPTILVASSGETVLDPELGKKYLVLKKGRRYVGRPGEGGYEVVEFDQYAQKLPEPDYAVKAKKATDGMSTSELFSLSSPQARAALEWRLSLPLLVIIIGVMAMPLSRSKPRGGRYGKLVPAILIYMVYLVCVNAARGAIEAESSKVPGLIWLVHGCFFVLGVIMYNGPKLLQPLQRLSARRVK
ncbi:MAG: lipopolysaccharide export system permease protein [Flavobacteriales bacterium]